MAELNSQPMFLVELGFMVVTEKITTFAVSKYTLTDDFDTGIGRSAANKLSLIAGGVSGAEITSAGVSGSVSSTGSFGILETQAIKETALGVQLGDYNSIGVAPVHGDSRTCQRSRRLDRALVDHARRKAADLGGALIVAVGVAAWSRPRL